MTTTFHNRSNGRSFNRTESQTRIRNLSEAQQLLRSLEMRQCPSDEMLSEYTEALNSVVNAISNLRTDDDCCSNTSLTLPETVTTNDSASFLVCGGSVGREDREYTWIEQQQHEEEPMYWRGEEDDGDRDEADESDDELSICSDCMPLTMTDEDALDEIDFTREMMGYQEGFDENTCHMAITRIEEGKDAEFVRPCSSPKSPKKQNQRLPLPTRRQPSHGSSCSSPKSSRKQNQRLPLQVTRQPSHGSPSKPKGIRRNNSGGSAPTAMGAVAPVAPERKRLFRPRTSVNRSLPEPEHRVVACIVCQRMIYEGARCQCGMWEI